ncbi:hypothetical protein H072_4681 [Dactylellina haptotyla CBS 200.50]|uniref:F-box domain-containing protein n=1 Tax=Dactylellina haptotyla (strain CBS 200.50) TaxID=1284197 RepID=S8AEH1_DACHA|nr:hypothetical protein H072_4681 [Dactylellina haptotyla CBS 200.50]
MESSSSRPTLLSLPLEIREIIYGSLIDLCEASPKRTFEDELWELRRPPSYTIYDGTKYHMHIRGSRRYLYPHTGQFIYFPLDLPQYPLLPILQTCHMIRIEFQDFLQRLSNKASSPHHAGLSYVLDMEAGDGRIIPIWRSLPLPPEKPYNFIPELRINYTFCDFLTQHKLSDGDLYYIDKGDLTDRKLNLIYLLNLILWHGPQGVYLPSVNGTGGAGPTETRCQPFFKKVVFNARFYYDRDITREIERGLHRFEIPAIRDNGIWRLGEWFSWEENASSGVPVTFLEKLAIWKKGHCRDYADLFYMLVKGGFLDGFADELVVLCEGEELWGHKELEKGSRLTRAYHVGDGEKLVTDQGMLVGLPGAENLLFRWGPIRAFRRCADGVPQER